MRLSLTLGFHQNVRGSQITDRVVQQRRIRIWWTVYVLDRMLASKIGYPILIRHDDIEVDLPSDAGLSKEQKEDFVEADYLTASVQLARIAGRIVSTLYSRKRLPETFTRRVQTVFKDLTEWFATLPENLAMRPEKACGQAARRILSLHLAFNQVRHLRTTGSNLH